MTELLDDRILKPVDLAPPARPRVVYADCRAALQLAWYQGLPRDVPVRTVAPSILADESIDAQPAH